MSNLALSPGRGTILKTHAIALRVSPYSNTSQIVTWLTAEAGRVVTMVKGARRPRSAFLGQYDLFYGCELLYYRRERQGLHIAKECTPLAPRPTLRTDWRAFSCASYCAHLCLHTSNEAQPQPELYDLLASALDFLAEHGAKPELPFWFEVQLLNRLGLLPDLARCGRCREAVVNRRSFWGTDGIICYSCAPAEDAVPVTRDLSAVLSRWRDAAEANAVRAIRCSTQQLLVLRRILGTFLAHHVDVSPDSRRIALSLMRATQQPRDQVKPSYKGN